MTATRSQVRGSGVLLGGRMFAIIVNLAVQVITVRYLSQSDYGAFAYALSIVATVETVGTLGLDRTVSRFVPTYHEHDDVPRLFGTLATVVATISTVGVAAVVAVIAGAGILIGSEPEDDLLRALVVILVALGPVQALDHLCENVLASFGRARSIVMRRHVLGPLLKLAAIGSVIWLGQSVDVLAVTYLAAGVIGLALYGPLLVGTLREAGLLQRFRLAEVRMPVRALFAFALPLLAIDAALVVRTAVDAIIVEAYHGTAEVALLRSVQPVARLNQLVFASFAILFTPLAARLLARSEPRALDDLYWQSAAWQALVSFPIVAATTALAAELAVLLFGLEYAASAPVLALLAIGYYANAATGQNGLTLRVFGRIRWLITAALIGGGLTLALDLILIPDMGAVGAAAAAAVGLVGQNVVNQVSLHRSTSIGLPSRRIVGLYLSLVAALAGVTLAMWLVRPGLLVGMAFIAAVSIGLGIAFRRDLRLATTFPELRRIPIIGRWI